ncbi:MAG: ParB/RepB/Spo0J family partition protein [Armatimonadota bacterium]
MSGVLTAEPSGDYAARHNPALPELLELDPAEIRFCPINPRMLDDADESLRLLAENIREHGLKQPITVRETGDATQPYEVVAGERRLRACRLAGLPRIRAFNEGAISLERAFETTIAENEFREQLSPIEQARAIEQARGAFNWPQEKIGRLFGGKSQSWISRTCGLLRLPAAVQELLKTGQLSRTNAEELLALARWQGELIRIAEDAAREKWTQEHTAEIVAKRKRTLEEREQPSLQVMDEPEQSAAPRQAAAPVPAATTQDELPKADELVGSMRDLPTKQDLRSEPAAAPSEPAAVTSVEIQPGDRVTWTEGGQTWEGIVEGREGDGWAVQAERPQPGPTGVRGDEPTLRKLPPKPAAPAAPPATSSSTAAPASSPTAPPPTGTTPAAQKWVTCLVTETDHTWLYSNLLTVSDAIHQARCLHEAAAQRGLRVGEFLTQLKGDETDA